MMKSIASMLFVLVAALVLSSPAQARYADGMNQYAAYHVMHGAVDPMGTTIIAKCEVAEWLIENKRVDAFDMKQLGGRDMYHYTSHAVFSDGDLEGEILAKMIRSKRNFQVTEGTIENLQKHVDSRVGVVNAVLQVKFDFGVGDQCKWNKDYWKLNPGRVGASLQVKRGVNRYDALQDVLNNPEKYTLACFTGTQVAYFAGIANALGEKEWNALNKPSSKTDKGIPKNDWIPGDWGYIENKDPNPALGLEGENIVYVGENLGDFWGHLPGDNSLRRLDEWMDQVNNWSDRQNSAKLQPTRNRPTIGLSN